MLKLNAYLRDERGPPAPPRPSRPDGSSNLTLGCHPSSTLFSSASPGPIYCLRAVGVDFQVERGSMKALLVAMGGCFRWLSDWLGSSRWRLVVGPGPPCAKLQTSHVSSTYLHAYSVQYSSMLHHHILVHTYICSHARSFTTAGFDPLLQDGKISRKWNQPAGTFRLNSSEATLRSGFRGVSAGPTKHLAVHMDGIPYATTPRSMRWRSPRRSLSEEITQQPRPPEEQRAPWCLSVCVIGEKRRGDQFRPVAFPFRGRGSSPN